MRSVLAIITFTLLSHPVIHFGGYLGGRQKDAPNALAVDREGYIYVVGQTDSPDFPSTLQALRKRSGANNIGVDMRLKQPSSGCRIQTGSVEIASSKLERSSS